MFQSPNTPRQPEADLADPRAQLGAETAVAAAASVLAVLVAAVAALEMLAVAVLAKLAVAVAVLEVGWEVASAR